MIKRKNLIISGVAIIAFLAYTGGVFMVSQKNLTETLKKNETNTTKFIEEMANDSSVTETESEMGEWFKKLDEENRTKIVDACIYYASNRASQITFTDDEKTILKNATDEAFINIEKIEDENLKKKVENLKEDHLTLRYLNESISVEIDYAYYKDTYQKDITKGYYNILDFYDSEKSESYGIPSEYSMNVSVVEKRLDTLYDMKQNKENESVKAFIEAAEEFYKSIYLGIYESEYSIYQGYIQDNVRASYTSWKPKDPELAAYLPELAKLYDETDGMRTVNLENSIFTFMGYQLDTNSDSESESGDRTEEGNEIISETNSTEEQ